jgi:uncharacterized membrane protein
MAGVSLGLRSFLGSRSYAAQSSAYLYAGLAMAGPWILTSLTMSLLQVWNPGGTTPAAREDFQAFVLFSYASSMVLTGFFQLPVSRYVSDGLYLGDASRVLPSYMTAASVSLVLHAGLGIAFVLATRADLLTALSEICLLGSLSQVWVGMIFLGVLRKVRLILLAFASGMGASILASQTLFRFSGLPGLLLGFAMGNALLAALLAGALRAEFPSARAFDFGFLRTVRTYPLLLLAGLAYATGIWIDKAVFWMSPFAVWTRPGVPSFPIYDNASYLAFATTLPALGLIFIRLEVSFHEKYWSFYQSFRAGEDLRTIRNRRKELATSFRITLGRVFLVQATATLAGILFAGPLLRLAGMDEALFFTFRLLALSALPQIMMLVIFLVALHLALYGVAFIMMAVYCLAAAWGTWISIVHGPQTYGIAPVAAALSSALLGYPLVRRILRTLESKTLMSQPID